MSEDLDVDTGDHDLVEAGSFFICRNCHAGRAAFTQFQYIECPPEREPGERDPLEERGP